MKHFSPTSLAFRPTHLHLFSLFALNLLCFTPKISAFASTNEIDNLALLKFKESISSDPYEIFLSWNTSTHFCNWFGITCNSKHQRVTELNLERYRLKGSISPYVGNLSYMRSFNLGNNNFYGIIPQELGRLSQLQFLSVSNNSLVGKIPTNLIGCTHLKILFLGGNHLIGNIPFEFGSLWKLQQLYVYNNNLTGGIPSFIGNLSSLTDLSVSANNLEGDIPQEICRLRSLRFLSLDNNQLTGTFPSCLYNISSLLVFSASINQISGSLPPNMFHTLPNLQYFLIGKNHISGSIPPSISNASMLSKLDLCYNNFTGQVPSLRKLHHLYGLAMGWNNVGENSTNDLDFLKSLTNSSKLKTLYMPHNNFGGHLPSSLGNLSVQVSQIILRGNQITGELKAKLGNLLTQFLHEKIANPLMTHNYPKINVVRHFLPISTKTLNKLFYFSTHVLQNNSFLQYFNVSFNMLDGEVPTEGVFQNASEFIVTGNNKLCGGISELYLPPCPVNSKKHEKYHKFRLIIVIIGVVSFLVIMSIVLTILLMKKRSKNPSLESPTIDQLAKVSYQSLHNGTDGFSTTNLIGSGNFSSVYKGSIELEDKVVAIKVLKLHKKGAHKSFIIECNALKNIKHRNLVQILTCCSSTDYKGQEFKALIFEYMRNGSLEQWLHPMTPSVEHPRTLSLDQRLNIMIDVASALHYLHHECEQPIIHCDLKPSNVLLDDDMIAHVSDFGIARLLSTINGTTSKQTSTIGIKGTIGYAPPEYGVGSEVSTYGDMYSFGILMLEMLTGRRPIEEMFEDGQNLHNFVAISFLDNLLQILDPQLIPIDEAAILEGNNWSLDPNVEKCLVSLFRVGLACSMESPKERMDVVGVTGELNRIRKAFTVGERM
ncbi:probable LRR receptor-like serine/threonine-protein kinase At3g47570 [Cajanus cajan]|uniref:probable LRR receptor-like serine/threonine-protein kinase At3g47570 n=1 Tax=Cajanus cajan TaxID=3821 RepID=UPI00098D937A|nr:probable LRR receptor-like serine/threonine-protein kinase At3g47570 [Cajanus cajan]